MSLKILLNGLEYFFTDRHHGRQNVFHGLTEERQNVFLSAGVSIGQFKGSFNLGNRMGRSLVLPNFIFYDKTTKRSTYIVNIEIQSTSTYSGGISLELGTGPVWSLNLEKARGL